LEEWAQQRAQIEAERQEVSGANSTPSNGVAGSETGENAGG
jgi:hypothetical protein